MINANEKSNYRVRYVVNHPLEYIGRVKYKLIGRNSYLS